MLETKQINTFEDKIAFLKAFDINTGLWIVPHLQIKHDLQNFYITSHKSLIGDPFRTITEFWIETLLHCYPEIQVLSESSIKAFIKNELQKRKAGWCHLSGSAHIIFQILTHTLPVICHVEGPELLSQWLATHPSAKERWGKYCLEAFKIWRQIEGKFITPQWIPGILSQASQDLNLSKTLVVDMGCDLLPSDMQVFQQLSRQTHVVVICPDLHWFKKYPNEFIAYTNEYNPTRSIPTVFSNELQNITAKRFASMLAEVKDATATIRTWIDQGVDLDHIVVTSPNMKNYWPVLNEYLEFEGVPHNQAPITRLNYLPDLIQWISRLQIQLKPQADFSALETAVFTGQNRYSQPSVNYEKFHQTFSRILDPLDYQRSQYIHNLISKNVISKSTPIDALSFLTYAQTFWQESSVQTSIETLEQIFHIFLEESKGLPSLKPLYWLELLEQIISQTYLSSQDISLKAIHICDLASANKWFAQKIYIMGLCEQDIKSIRPSLLNNTDVFSIKNELGFTLDLPERSPIEVYVDMIFSNPSIDKVISFPETDFVGKPLTPSLLWLNASKGQATQKPSITLWDMYQNKAQIVDMAKTVFPQLKRWSKKRLESTLETLLRDQHLQENVLLPSYQLTQLSVGALDRYDKCPFIFYAQDVLKLKKLPALEMDVQALHQGLMLHHLLSSLTQEPFSWQYTDQQLDEMITDYLSEHKIIAEPQFQKSFKEANIQLLQSFLQFESQWRKEFPQTKVLLREADVAGYIHPQTGDISPTQTEGAILIKGRLDRLDQVGERAFAIIDYKLSLGGKTNYGSWLKNGDFQLGMYALMLKQGCIPDVSGDIVAAVYFGLKEMKRDKGFLLKEYDKSAHIIKTSHHKITKEGLEEFFKNIKESVMGILSGIARGDFQANPKDKKTCVTCHWRQICKAPHL